MLNPLSKVQNLKDPIKQFTVNMNIAFKAGSALASLIDSENLELRAQSFGLPTITGDKTEVDWGGFHRTYAGKQTRDGDWTIKVTEVWDSSITEAFRKWNNAYHQYKDGKISLLDSYTATVNVALVNPDLYDPVPEGIQKYNMRMYDVFPTSVTFPEIQTSSSNPVELTIALHYNYFLMGEEIEG